jgi:hypothetical protein
MPPVVVIRTVPSLKDKPPKAKAYLLHSVEHGYAASGVFEFTLIEVASSPTTLIQSPPYCAMLIKSRAFTCMVRQRHTYFL